MNQKDFDSLKARRHESMLLLVWPEIEKRMTQGLSPTVIASQMEQEGYWGLTSNHIGVPYIHRLWQLAVQTGLTGK